METSDKMFYAIIYICGVLIATMVITILLSSCTINFSNVSTNGEASDVVDTEQAPTNDVKADLEIPLKPL